MLDILTLNLLASATILAFAIGLTVLWAADRRRRIAGIFAASFYALALAYCVVGLRRAVPFIPELLSILVANGLIGVGAAMFWRAARVSAGRSPLPAIEASIVLLWLVVRVFSWGDVNIRLATNAAFIVVFAGLAAYEILRTPRARWSLSDRLMLSVFVFLALYFSVAAPIWGLARPLDHLFGPSNFQASVYLVAIAATAVLTFAALWQSFATLTEALSTANAKLERTNQDLMAVRDGLEVEVAQRTLENVRVTTQLHQAQKMEAIGQLTGGIAHDFNNLLGVVAGNIELIEAKLADRPELRSRLAVALKAVDRGASLTQQLLAFSRRQQLKLRSLDIREQIEGMTTLLRRTLGPAIEITTELPRDLWLGRSDPAQLQSALLNLAINARDALPTGGLLTIAAANIAIDDGRKTPGSTLVGDYVRITVSDTGTGMSEDVRARAFEPFFTTKEIGKGSGLGLSMIYGFMQQSGGHVEIESAPGKGTLVALYVPRETAETAAVIDGRPAAPIAAMRAARILVVEDNEALREVAIATATSAGHVAIGAGNSAAALALLAKEPIDILFTDIVLPGNIDGFALARAAIAQRPDLKVLFTSGYPLAARLGADQAGHRILHKPYRVSDLAVEFSRLIRA